MEHTTYIVDGQTLVDNIHKIKQWVYTGIIRIHIPLSSLETVEQLYTKSLEPKEAPKDERQQKHQSGRPRKEYPLFDINPRTAQEFLERAKSESGLHGVSFQLESGEEFSQWKEEDDKSAKASEQPLAPPSSFSEALLRKLNISQPEKEDSGLTKPKLVAKPSHGKTSPFRYHKVPTVQRQNIPEALQPLFTTALWRVHEYENNPLSPKSYALLVQDNRTLELACTAELPSVLFSQLHTAILTRQSLEDQRSSLGMAEAEFPDAPKHVVPLIEKLQPVVPQETNGHVHLHEDIEERLEATALSTIEELLGLSRAGKDVMSGAQSPSAELRPSISYAMAAGAKNLVVKPIAIQPALAEADATSIPPPIQTPDAEKATEVNKDDINDESSDEEVVLFVGKKRRSQEVSRGVSRPLSRPTTAGGKDLLSSPKPSKAFVESSLKPQSPVFTPGQLYKPASPVQRSTEDAYPTPISKQNSPIRRTPPPKQVNASSPRTRAKGHGTPRTPRGVNGQARPATSEDAQRQAELILQRQREAIKRSAQIQEAQAARAQQDIKAPAREVEMKPTNNPVVIDPDEFSRDYTIRANSSEQANGRGKGSGRRGGRGRGGKGQHQQQHNAPQDGAKKDPDFVLKSGAPRGSTRGKGKLWVP